MRTKLVIVPLLLNALINAIANFLLGNHGHVADVLVGGPTSCGYIVQIINVVVWTCMLSETFEVRFV